MPEPRDARSLRHARDLSDSPLADAASLPTADPLARRDLAALDQAAAPHLAPPAAGRSAPSPSRGPFHVVMATVATLVLTFLLAAGVGSGMAWAVAVASVAAIGVGLVLAHLLIVVPAARTAADLLLLAERLDLLGAVDRAHSFERMVFPDGHVLAPLSRAVHRALTDAHRHRLAAARVHREMSHRVTEQTRLATAALAKQALTDPLTGLANRRLVDELLPALVDQAIAQGSELAVLLIDVDHFKRLNDTAGHDAGDAALTALAEILKGQFRHTDVAARIGGDEFLVLLPGMTRVQALAATGRVQSLYAQHPSHARLAVGRPSAGGPPTLSIGVALLGRDHADSPENLLQLADAALYAAKRSGRARTCTVDDLTDAA